MPENRRIASHSAQHIVAPCASAARASASETGLTQGDEHRLAADVFLLPRLSRVTPRPLFQAMACGVPVVASAIGGAGEFVYEGKTECTVDLRDPILISKRIVHMLRHPELALRIGRSARDFANRQLAWSVIVRRMRDEV